MYYLCCIWTRINFLKLLKLCFYHLVHLFQISWSFVKWKLRLFSITDPLISQFEGFSDSLIGLKNTWFWDTSTSDNKYPLGTFFGQLHMEGESELGMR